MPKSWLLSKQRPIFLVMTNISRVQFDQLINCHVSEILNVCDCISMHSFQNGSYSAMVVMPSGFWLLVWEWIHAICLHSLSIRESWTIWEEFSWQLCGRGLGPDTWMVRYSLHNLWQLYIIMFLLINKNFVGPSVFVKSCLGIKSTWGTSDVVFVYFISFDSHMSWLASFGND